MRTAKVTVHVDYCDCCPNAIKGRLNDYCDVADKPIPEIYGNREIPEWCPCLDIDSESFLNCVVAWLHILDNTDGIPENTPIKKVAFSQDNPFGIAGKDYSSEYNVTSIPLYKNESV